MIKNGDLVRLQHLSSIDFCADDFGVSQADFEDLLEAQARGDCFEVIDTQSGDGLDCTIALCGDDWQVELRTYHLKPVV